MSIKHPVLAIMSPAKSLKSEKDILSITTHLQPTRPVYSAKADGLAALLKKKKAGEIAASMKISAALAKGVSELFEQYQIDAPSEGYQAALLYDGPAYRGLQYEELTQAQCKKAQKCVRFISGLYGVLKPSDCIQPYRLEMSMKPSDMGLSGAKSLSAYWCEDITREINATLGDKAESILLNVASEEYSKAIDMAALHPSIRVVGVRFLDGGKVKSVYAKRARGLMARYVSCSPTPNMMSMEELQGFDLEGYRYSARESSEAELVFARSEGEAGSAKKKQKV